MRVVQRFQLQTPTDTKDLLELADQTVEHMHLREYMLSLYRLRALDKLLLEQPRAVDVMKFMSNIADIWRDFHKSAMRMGDSDIDDLITAYNAANLTWCDDLFKFLEEFKANRPPGILLYCARLE